MPRLRLGHLRPTIITRADLARDGGEWQRAAGLYGIALERAPNNPPIWIQYGHALKESGRPAEAENAYRTAIAHAPADADAHLQLGHVLKLQGKRAEAEVAYRQAWSLDRSSAESARELAGFGWTRQRLAEAADRSTPTSAREQPHAAASINGPTRRSSIRRRKEGLITRADRAQRARQWPLAVRLYRTALDRNPDNPPIWVQYGHALKESGDVVEAERAYRAAISYAPGVADTHLQLGHALKLQGKTEEAQAAYLRSFAVDPSLPHPLLELGGLGWPERNLYELRQIIGDAPSEHPGTAREPDRGRSSAAAKPVFSVVIPVYDRTWELREALDSVLSQSFPDFEVIIVTDASPPETMAVIDDYIRKDKRIRTFSYADNSGSACRGRNRGIIEARGEFISLLDSDDLYFSDTLEKAYRIFRELQVDFVCGRAYFIVDGTRRVGNYVTGSTNDGGPINMDRFLRGENPIQTCTAHIRRDVMVKYGGFRVEQRYLEDLELWLRLAYYGCRFYYSDELFAKYRFHQDNLELKYINQKDYWLEHLRNNYMRPLDNWGIEPAMDRTDLQAEERPDMVPVWPGRVDAAWYLRQYPDIGRAGADPLIHYIEDGRREGRKPNAAEASADGWISVADVEISCLKRPLLLGPEVAIFVTHLPSGQLKPHLSHYLDCLTRQGISVILILATDEPFTAADTSLMSRVNGVFIRHNAGYDFAAWAHVLRLHPELANATILYLLNDSVFGPTNDAAFNILLQRIRHSGADFIGLTQSFERGWHLQSYFLALKARTLSSLAFREFIESIVCYRDKEKVINEYEVRFAAFMRIAGLNCEAIFQKTDFRNPTLYHWRYLIEAGFPFLKVATVRDVLPDVDVSDWREVLREQGYNVSLAERTLDELSAQRFRLQERSPVRSAGSSRNQREPVLAARMVYSKNDHALHLIKHISAYIGADPYISKGTRAISCIYSEQEFRFYPREPLPSHRSREHPTAAISQAERASQTLATGSDILILSHDLSESGAPRAAYDIARALSAVGHFVVVASPVEGPYGERLRAVGANLIIDERLLLRDPWLRNFASNFDRVICNTIVCWPAVEQLAGLGGLVWYVHESEALGRLARDFPELVATLRKEVPILVPSPLVERALLAQSITSRVIPYGSEDHPAGWNSFETHGSGKLVIGVFGSYESRKGQDLAVRGMLSITDDLRGRAEMRLFGRTLEPRFREDIEASAGGDTSISFFGEVDHDECLRQMAATDIILIPSRDDPLPFVSLDALALGKPLVCSATTGTSAYLRQDKSGLILHQNTPEEIGSALGRLIIDPRLRQTLGIGARELYRQMFTREAFEANIFQGLGLQ